MKNKKPQITTRYETMRWIDLSSGHTVVKGVLKFDNGDGTRPIVGAFSCPVQHEIDGDEVVKRLQKMGWRVHKKRRGYINRTAADNSPLPGIEVYFVDMTRPASGKKPNRLDMITAHGIDFQTNRPMARNILPADIKERRAALRELGVKMSDTPLV